MTIFRKKINLICKFLRYEKINILFKTNLLMNCQYLYHSMKYQI